jgi:hypothetical protein
MFYHYAAPAWLIIIKNCVLVSESVNGLKPLILGRQGKCVTTRLPHLAYVCKTSAWLIMIIKNCVRVSAVVARLKPLILG